MLCQTDSRNSEINSMALPVVDIGAQIDILGGYIGLQLKRKRRSEGIIGFPLNNVDISTTGRV